MELSQKMHITTVVEGVETREDEAFICSLGCDYGQGYYYSKPISAEVFHQTYMERRTRPESSDDGSFRP